MIEGHDRETAVIENGTRLEPAITPECLKVPRRIMKPILKNGSTTGAVQKKRTGGHGGWGGPLLEDPNMLHAQGADLVNGSSHGIGWLKPKKNYCRSFNPCSVAIGKKSFWNVPNGMAPSYQTSVAAEMSIGP